MKCCICGTVRNCESYLNKIFENMGKIGEIFDDYKIILYYDKSSDNTLSILKEYQKKNNRLHFYVNKSALLEYRTHRLALGRNFCINFIKKKYIDYPYFIMMDCDDRCAYNVNINLLKNYLNRNDWDSLSFNHPAGYYDTWALSKRPYIASCHHFGNPSLGGTLISKIISKTPKHQLIPCFSAFNGFAIYRTPKFINCYYDGRMRLDYIPKLLLKENFKYAGKMNINGAKEDCEHRHFHFQAILENSARIRISPLCLFI
jgi:hypothetical protein